uniref:Uncharacterized protein n=1 Tax=Meloidogyne enterolobii TaxID=390850 RepID=A0A6V7WLU1_MELEN|nr:unnamed protein product [Meloidogyne enterolobii]
MQISIFDYIESFDFYEVSANNLHIDLENNALKIMHDTGKLFKTLHEDELYLASKHYRIQYSHNNVYDDEENMKEFLQTIPLMHVYKKIDDWVITSEEFEGFESFLIENEPSNTYNLYELYHSDYVIKNFGSAKEA